MFGKKSKVVPLKNGSTSTHSRNGILNRNPGRVAPKPKRSKNSSHTKSNSANITISFNPNDAAATNTSNPNAFVLPANLLYHNDGTDDDYKEIKPVSKKKKHQRSRTTNIEQQPNFLQQLMQNDAYNRSKNEHNANTKPTSNANENTNTNKTPTPTPTPTVNLDINISKLKRNGVINATQKKMKKKSKQPKRRPRQLPKQPRLPVTSLPPRNHPSIGEFYSRKARKKMLQQRQIPSVPELILVCFVLMGRVFRCRLPLAFSHPLTKLLPLLSKYCVKNDEIMSLVIREMQYASSNTNFKSIQKLKRVRSRSILQKLNFFSEDLTMAANEDIHHDTIIQRPIFLYKGNIMDITDQQTLVDIGFQQHLQAFKKRKREYEKQQELKKKLETRNLRKTQKNTNTNTNTSTNLNMNSIKIKPNNHSTKKSSDLFLDGFVHSWEPEFKKKNKPIILQKWDKNANQKKNGNRSGESSFVMITKNGSIVENIDGNGNGNETAATNAGADDNGNGNGNAPAVGTNLNEESVPSFDAIDNDLFITIISCFEQEEDNSDLLSPAGMGASSTSVPFPSTTKDSALNNTNANNNISLSASALSTTNDSSGGNIDSGTGNKTISLPRSPIHINRTMSEAPKPVFKPKLKKRQPTHQRSKSKHSRTHASTHMDIDLNEVNREPMPAFLPPISDSHEHKLSKFSGFSNLLQQRTNSKQSRYRDLKKCVEQLGLSVTLGMTKTALLKLITNSVKNAPRTEMIINGAMIVKSGSNQKSRLSIDQYLQTELGLTQFEVEEAWHRYHYTPQRIPSIDISSAFSRKQNKLRMKRKRSHSWDANDAMQNIENRAKRKSRNNQMNNSKTKKRGKAGKNKQIQFRARSLSKKHRRRPLPPPSSMKPLKARKKNKKKKSSRYKNPSPSPPTSRTAASVPASIVINTDVSVDKRKRKKTVRSPSGKFFSVPGKKAPSAPIPPTPPPLLSSVSTEMSIETIGIAVDINANAKKQPKKDPQSTYQPILPQLDANYSRRKERQKREQLRHEIANYSGSEEKPSKSRSKSRGRRHRDHSRSKSRSRSRNKSRSKSRSRRLQSQKKRSGSNDRNGSRSRSRSRGREKVRRNGIQGLHTNISRSKSRSKKLKTPANTNATNAANSPTKQPTPIPLMSPKSMRNMNQNTNTNTNGDNNGPNVNRPAKNSGHNVSDMNKPLNLNQAQETMRKSVDTPVTILRRGYMDTKIVRNTVTKWKKIYYTYSDARCLCAYPHQYSDPLSPSATYQLIRGRYMCDIRGPKFGKQELILSIKTPRNPISKIFRGSSSKLQKWEKAFLT